MLSFLKHHIALCCPVRPYETNYNMGPMVNIAQAMVSLDHTISICKLLLLPDYKNI